VAERHALELVAGLDLRGELLDCAGREEVAVVGDERVPELPAPALDSGLIEDRPERSRVIVRRRRAFVDRERRVDAVVVAVDLFDPLLAAVPPVARLVRTSLKKRLPTWFTAMNSWKPAAPTLTPAEPRNPNVGWPGIKEV
jgi:hypothetical protein